MNANDVGLRRDERNERLVLLGLLVPALLLIGLFVLVPVGMLVFLSFTDGAGGFTLDNYLRLVDGDAYMRVFLTTFEISLVTTAICVVLALPLSYWLTRLPGRVAGLLMILILIPLWTSVLVRTYAWMVILQRNGVINQAGMALGLWDTPLALSFNETGVLIGTVHIMLPYMVLPIYAAMKKIDISLEQAAATLGASPMRAFLTVFLPLSMSGVAAGALITFVLCLGFYVVPEILGGGRVVMLAIQTAKDVQVFYNWGAAGALGVVLLVVTIALMALANRFTPRRLGADQN
ncbi:ABC transporter permease [Verticiella sediminum]|uniref:ABC transporter permease n=1 Tax=Verticiella sediminum TaxID=1247510 RepID=A0A556AVL3_9BURK|nr:ABC transporter permease [Verticiella sediminum]TSH96425.1 ABC transporter permease [Verticiella sediminum]